MSRQHISIRARLFYRAMRTFFGVLMPANLPLSVYRKASNQPFFEPMPRGIHWENSAVNGVQGEWITPANADTRAILLYLHGGGYVLSTPRVHRVLVGPLAHAIGCRAFMPNYRLAPEHPFPAALNDVLAVYQELQTVVSSSKIVIAGASAGGGLAMALVIRLRELCEPLPSAVGLISAVLDCTFSDEISPELQKLDPYLRLTDISTMTKAYYAEHDPRHPLISPLFADLVGLPPLLIYSGEYEILRPQSKQFIEKAQETGLDVTHKIWTRMIHAFPLFAGFIPEGQMAIKETGHFFRRNLSPNLE